MRCEGNNFQGESAAGCIVNIHGLTNCGSVQRETGTEKNPGSVLAERGDFIYHDGVLVSCEALHEVWRRALRNGAR